jgi:hypothetical protein
MYGEGMLMLLRVGILPVDMQIVLFNSDRQLCPVFQRTQCGIFTGLYVRQLRYAKFPVMEGKTDMRVLTRFPLAVR